MIKAVFALFLTCSCYLFSLELWQTKNRAAETARRLSDCILKMLPLLQFSLCDVYKITKDALSADFPAFKEITSGDFPEAFETCCQKTFKDPETARQALLISDILGRAGADLQSERLRIISEDLRKRAEQLRKKAERDRKVYGAMGAFLGLSLSIMTL